MDTNRKSFGILNVKKVLTQEIRKNQLIYRVRANVLGSQYVSDDPIVAETHSRDFYVAVVLNNRSPDFIALPGRAEDIHGIIRLASHYHFPFSAIGTGLLFVLTGSIKEYW